MDTGTVLVIGGSRQMGVHVVEKFLCNGWDVTVANRGKDIVNYSKPVNTIICDRFDEQSLKSAFVSKSFFDVIVDMAAFNGTCIDLLKKYVNTSIYVLFSSISVYPRLDIKLNELDYTPNKFDLKLYNETLEKYTAGDYKYQIGKRAAEYKAQLNYENNIIIRIPSVGGIDALSQTLKRYVQAIYFDEEIYLDKIKYERKFAITHTSEPASLVYFLISNNLKGIFNVASDGYLTNEMIVNYIQWKLKKKAIINWGDRNDCFHVDFPEHTLDCTKAKLLGYDFMQVDEWVWDTLDYYINNIK